ncbi:TPA: fibronectin type III-like domain-contianing protein [Streptococcus suis]|nr:fibronectin type III-like domain-contianing protein [Streptococcus suis]
MKAWKKKLFSRYKWLVWIFKGIKISLLSILSILSVLLLVVANVVLPSISKMGNNMLGYAQEIDNSKANTEGLDLQYYTSDYDEESIGEATQKLSDQIASEGVVLLKNKEESLPLKKGQEVSFFGVSSNGIIKGSGLMAIGSILGGGKSELKAGFDEAGLPVNTTLWDYYAQVGEEYGLGEGSINFGDAEDFSINEVPLAELQSVDNLLQSAEGTHPIFVLKRVAGEGRDMPRSMYNHTDIAEDQVKTYLEPNSEELEVLQYLNENFDDITLLVQSNAALDLDWVDGYSNIKSIVYAPTIDKTLGKIFTGEINPSGRTVDTFVSDALASPAAQNFGSHLYYDEYGNPTVYNYISYLEGIYVGYKYYETRYEDTVLGQGNTGGFSYLDEVVYPFGFGLSYTNFTWDNYRVTQTGDRFTIKLDVTNTGDITGKEVVQVYSQAPYTQYDKEHGIEKASVNLVGYTKTDELEPGQKTTVTITVNKEDFKVYDAKGQQTYILEAGDYYLTAARHSHEAVNNILAIKGHKQTDSREDMVYQFVQAGDDFTTYAKDTYSGAEIHNLFDDAKGDYTYLSRQDWTGTFPETDGVISDEISTWGNSINGEDENGNPASYTIKKTASAELIEQLQSTDSGNPVDPSSIKTEIVYGEDNGLSLVEMRGLDFDDPRWEELLDQLTAEDYYTLLTQSGYGTEPLKSVGKPFTIDADTASRLIYGGTGASYPNMMTLAQTYNEPLAEEYGEMIGNEALIGGANGWYAPSMNIHRTPFSGRNGEYYSEDPFLSGTIAAAEVRGAARKGMYTFIKHFAINDQENHRGDRTGQYGLATWSNEQAIRELYLKPFEMALKSGNVTMNYLEKQEDGNYEMVSKEMRAGTAVMSAFNRIGATWTGGSYSLIHGILRDEWDFDGFVITDNANTGVFMDTYQMIEAGADAKLMNADDPTDFVFEKDNQALYYYARQAAHRVLYTVANSNSMNGAMPGSVFKQGIQKSSMVRIGLNLFSIGYLSFILWKIIKFVKRFKKKEDKNAA